MIADQRHAGWRIRMIAVTLAAALALAASPALAQEDDELPEDLPDELPSRGEALESQMRGPEVDLADVPLSAAVRTIVDDDLLTDAQRTRLRIFHGLYDELSDEQRHTPAALLARYELDHPNLTAEDAPPLLRAEAAVLRGDVEHAIDLLEGRDEPRARLLLGRAYESLGRPNKAVDALQPLREALRNDDLQGAADITAGAEAMELLAVLEGRPAADYHFIMSTLDRVTQRVDRLHWPAIVVQARLMLDKDNPEEAVGALEQALTLNPQATETWYLLGRVAIMGYNFDGLRQVVRKLRDINPDHVLADALEIEGYLAQRDADAAREVLNRALQRWPNHRRLLASAVAVAALRYDEPATQAAIARYEDAAGQNPLAHYLAGRYLSRARQYDAGAQMLLHAVERQPNWPAPRIELGLLLSQDGREQEAHQVLARVAELDPFNKRANNTLALLEDMAGYGRIETDHFIILYKHGIDAALAHDMPEPLEDIYRDVTAVFQHEPDRKTLIQIMPDTRTFAVRITGMPDIWTVGACTGTVIAIAPPREGRHQHGPFDWERVMRHEYAHTVNLSQTANRVPHWFTEAAAVAQEPMPRGYRTARLLAEALHEDELFDLEEINWAFVRPRRPQDRALAYAQSHWMYEYIDNTYGRQTILDMLDLAKQGVSPDRVVPEAVGESADAFLTGFHAWAAEQVAAWGLAPEPSREQLTRQIAEAEGDPHEVLADLLNEHPDHPDLLKLEAERLLEAGDDDQARAALQRYAAARPVDPWADRQLAEVALRHDDKQAAAEHLKILDLHDQERGVHAVRIMQLYRDLGHREQAQHFAHRALYRQPYNPSLREAAATIALQRGDMETALRHLRALTWIEDDRAIHHTRLAALLTRMDRSAEAHQAAQRARQLDPNAPVDRFLLDENPLDEEGSEQDPAVQ